MNQIEIFAQPVRRHDHRKPRKHSDDALSLLKREVVRIGTNGTRQGFKFAQQMFAAFPELKGA
jgi:hypothetical protein